MAHLEALAVAGWALTGQPWAEGPAVASVLHPTLCWNGEGIGIRLRR